MHFRSALLCALALPGVALGQAPAEIGSVTAANQAVTGTPPGGAQRPLVIGAGVVSEERIQTAPIGAGQFLFLDQTALNVWPNSDIVLDRYFYDAERSVGDIGVSLTRGVLRFIGGRISKGSDAEIRTPHAIAVVRGGIAHVEVTEDATRVVHIAGEYTRVGPVTLSRANAVAVARRGPDGVATVTYEGVLDAQGVAALLGQPLGRGAGGLVEAPSPATAAAAIDRSGAQALGSGDDQAPRRAPVSTLGEQPRPPFAPGLPEGPTLTDRQIAAAERAVVDPVAGIGPGGPTDPEDPFEPVDPVDPVAPQPQALAFTGVQFNTFGDAALDNVAVRASNVTQFTDFSRLEISPGSFRVRAEAANGRFFEVRERGGFNVRSGTFGGLPARVSSFDDSEVFYLAAFRRSASAQGSEARSLNFFGLPTPLDVWDQNSGPDAPLRRYQLSRELFTDAGLPAPTDLAPGFDDAPAPSFLLIGQPDGPMLGAFPDGGDAKWLSAQLVIEGEGVNQRAALGLLNAEAVRNSAGYPAMELTFFHTFLREDGLSGISRSRAFYGLIDDGAGVTTFGPDGDYLVLSRGARGVANAPGDAPFTTGSGTFFAASSIASSGVFNDTRLAVLQDRSDLAADARVTAGLPVAASPFAATAHPAISHVLTGGYAFAGAQAPGGAPYALATTEPQNVRLGFAPSVNAVFAEFSLLSAGDAPLSLSPLGDVFLNFGGADRRGAFADDRRFGARNALAPTGGISGQSLGANVPLPPSAAGPSGAPEDRAFLGILASADLVDAAAPQSEHLRWGWWAGEVFRETPTGGPDRLHLGAWVAGVQSDIADVRALSGSASYQGFAVANVIEDVGGASASYTRRGGFDMDYDFAARVGSVTLTNILAAPTTMAVAENPGGFGTNHFGGVAPGGGLVAGAFFDGAGAPAAAAAGVFRGLRGTGVEGGAAVADGVFGGDRR